METQIAIIQFLFKSNWKVLSDSLGANPALTSHKFDTAPEVLKFCATEQNCLILCNVSSKEDLIQLATFVKISRKSLKNTILKIVVINATENKQFEKAISKLGSVEIVEPNVNVKALRFKMDFWMKAMRAQSKKLGNYNQKTVEVSAQEAAVENKSLIQVAPLECENDIWLLTKESDCKRIIGRWMVKLMGPGPYVAQWVEVPNKPGIWGFQIKKTFIEQFIAGEGSWFFKGDQKPEFNWQENRWMFTGDSFELFFSDGKSNQSRMKVVNRVNTISGNSVYAKTKESLFIESFDKELVFKKGVEVLEGQTLDFENEGDLGGRLEGKIKDKEETRLGHLEGKVKEQEEAQGNLEGKVKEQEAAKGHLQGKIKDQEESKGALERKIKDKEESTPGHFAGQVKEKEEAKEALQGKFKGEEKENSQGKKASSQNPDQDGRERHSHNSDKNQKANKEKKHAQSSEHIPTSWNGKVSKDKEEKGPGKEDHRQHNEKLSQNWGGAVKDNSQGSSAPAPKGKSEDTDHPESHWGGKGSSSPVNTRGLSAPGSTDVREGSLLDLKQTDKEHQTHYKNHNEAQEYEASGDLGKHKNDSSEGGALGGKSSTDRLASHYGSGKKGEVSQAEKPGRQNTERSSESQSSVSQETKSSPITGKGKTDQLKSHYGSPGKKGQTSQLGDEELDDVINELEAAIDTPKASRSGNVLPFVHKTDEKNLEKLTESGTITSWIIQGGKKYECRLDDYFDNTAIFVSQGEGLKNSESAGLDIGFNFQGKNVSVNCEGLVLSIDQDGEGGFFITIEVDEEDAAKFDDFMELMKSRQENIASFMMMARGL